MKHLISSPSEALAHLKPLTRKKVEEIWTLALGPDLQLLGVNATFRGTRDRCLLHPREIFHYGIKKRATCLILAHNHPSGPPMPSRQDWTITRRMIFLGQMLQIPVVDHIIVGTRGQYSFRHYHKTMFERLGTLDTYNDKELTKLASAPFIEPQNQKDLCTARPEPDAHPSL